MVVIRQVYIVQVNENSAFLNGELQAELYTAQPVGFEAKGQENKVMRLHKALFELRKAGLVSNESLYKLVTVLGFENSKYDQSFYSWTETGGSHTSSSHALMTC